MRLLRDTDAVAEVAAEWAGVVRMRERMKTLVVVTFAGGALTAPALRKVLYNLPLLLAFDVLSQTLRQARAEGIFSCARGQLGNLMDGAKSAIPWIDWAGLREGVRRRNGVAHDGALFEQTVCLQDIANIEAQLTSWGVLDTDAAEPVKRDRLS